MQQGSSARHSDQDQTEGGAQSGKPAEYDRSAAQAGAAIKSSRRKKSAAAFRTISEVADELGVKQHVLRFWETKFSQVKPLKRGGGRRYYRPEDVELLQAIHRLLYVEGYTIKGVQKLLREAGKKQVVTAFSGGKEKRRPLTRGETLAAEAEAPRVPNSDKFTPEQREALQSVLDELKELRGMIKPRG